MQIKTENIVIVEKTIVLYPSNKEDAKLLALLKGGKL